MNLLRGCAEFRRAEKMNRRTLLEIGGLFSIGLTLPTSAHAQDDPRQRGGFGKAKSVILLYLHGGHAQQETWDPKPDGPTPERGQFGAIATSVSGIRISELLPHSAQQMHRLTLIRSLSHNDANHVPAALPAMTGHRHLDNGAKNDLTPPSSTDFPPFGAVLSTLRNPGPLPAWVQIGPLMRRDNGTALHGQMPGFLGVKHGPLAIDQDLLDARVRVRAVTSDPEVPVERLLTRQRLLDRLDDQSRQLGAHAEVKAFNDYRTRALDLVTSPDTAKAFRLADEPARVRDAYGKTQFGQSCLLARRLAEAGVPIINVHYCRTPEGSWDTHRDHFRQMKDSLAPSFDTAFAALVEDLAVRGLLDQVLVLATAEFGRTPKINPNGGRDHWPWVYSVALAGAGLRPGIVYGSSDKMAAYPTSHPHDPSDLAATIYHLLGVPADTQLRDSTDRPHHLVVGKKIDGLLA